MRNRDFPDFLWLSDPGSADGASRSTVTDARRLVTAGICAAEVNCGEAALPAAHRAVPDFMTSALAEGGGSTGFFFYLINTTNHQLWFIKQKESFICKKMSS